MTERNIMTSNNGEIKSKYSENIFALYNKMFGFRPAR
jgi:hypothetical protein